MMKAIVAILTGLCLASCTQFDAITINGASRHLTHSNTNHENWGIGFRKSNSEIGFYRNSLLKTSYSPYVSHRFKVRGRWFTDAGFAIYPDSKLTLKPIVKTGVSIPLLVHVNAEIAVAAVDLITVQLVIHPDDY